MIRILWLALSAAAAIILAALLQETAEPLLGGLTGAVIPDDPLVTLSGLVACGLLIFGIAGFAIPAVVEGLQVTHAQHKLRNLMDETLPGAHVTEGDFREVFAASPVLDGAAERASGFFAVAAPESAGLRHSEETISSRIESILPANRFFGPSELVDSRLRLWLFRPLPALLWGFAVITAVLAFARADADTNWGALVAIAASGFAIPVTAGVFLQFVTRLLGNWRRTQANALCSTLDCLLGFIPGQAPSRDLMAAAREQAELIESALREPLARLTKASTQLSEDQSAQVQQILRTTLKTFVGEVQGLVGQQINDIHVILKESTDIAQKLERSLTDSARTLTKFSKTQTSDMSEALDRYRSALTSFEDKSRRDFGADFKIILEKLDHGASAFRDATSGADALNRNVAPLLDELVATQKALLAAIGTLTANPPLMAPENDRNMLDRVKSLKPGSTAQSPAFNADFSKLKSLVGGSDLPEL